MSASSNPLHAQSSDEGKVVLGHVVDKQSTKEDGESGIVLGHVVDKQSTKEDGENGINGDSKDAESIIANGIIEAIQSYSRLQKRRTGICCKVCGFLWSAIPLVMSAVNILDYFLAPFVEYPITDEDLIKNYQREWVADLLKKIVVGIYTLCYNNASYILCASWDEPKEIVFGGDDDGITFGKHPIVALFCGQIASHLLYLLYFVYDAKAKGEPVTLSILSTSLFSFFLWRQFILMSGVPLLILLYAIVDAIYQLYYISKYLLYVACLPNRDGSDICSGVQSQCVNAKLIPFCLEQMVLLIYAATTQVTSAEVCHTLCPGEVVIGSQLCPPKSEIYSGYTADNRDFWVNQCAQDGVQVDPMFNATDGVWYSIYESDGKNISSVLQVCYVEDNSFSYD